MKNSKHCINVYLALFLLIVLVTVFPYKEGFDGDKSIDFTSWFTKKEKKEEESESDKKNDTKEKNKDASDNELPQFNN